MLTLHYIPRQEIASLDETTAIKKILDLVKNNRIVLLEGSLKPEEETNLFRKTMELIDNKFRGIEIATIYPKAKGVEFLDKIRKGISQLLLGHQGGVTVIGPATIVKEIKKDPRKIELFMKEGKKDKKRGK